MPGVVDVRVLGAIGVVELAAVDDLEALRAAFLAHGVWVRPLGRVVYLTPAFNIPDQDLALLTDAVSAVVRDHCPQTTT